MTEKKSVGGLALKIGLVLVLLGAMGLKLLDMRARSRATNAYDQVAERLNSEGGITAEQIHEMLGEPQDGYAPAEKQWIDRYAYRGVFREFAVLVKYNDSVARLLEGVEIE